MAVAILSDLFEFGNLAGFIVLGILFIPAYYYDTRIRKRTLLAKYDSIFNDNTVTSE